MLMEDVIHAGVDVETRPKVWMPGVLREAVCYAEQIILGKPNERTAHEGTKGQSVSSVGQRPGKRQQILRLLAPEKSLSCLRRDRKALLFQSALIAPELSPARR